MDRTLRATLLAGFLGFAIVAGTLLFLGLPVLASMGSGLVVGVLAGLLLWGAGRRADSFHGDQVTPVEPSFPGPPEHVDDAPVDRPDASADRPDRDATDEDGPDGNAHDGNAHDGSHRP